MEKLPTKAIGNWLFTGAIMVAIIVILGGITRLTNSGLSMVTWEPISGIIPPLNEEDWIDEFANYRSSPEFEIVNHSFELKDFKKIFWWEYLHRFFARMIGLVFILPFFYFLFTKKLSSFRLRIHLVVIFLLGAFQGFLGWYMVKSGLVDEPRVNHFRLASHLLSALLLLGYILWIGLHINYPATIVSKKTFVGIRRALRLFLFILLIQITYGAFVAGLHAGYFFPTFPMMGNFWGPQNVSLIFAEEGMISLVQNPFLVQFIHRWIPIILLLIGLYLILKTEKRAKVTVGQKWIIRFLVGMFTIQFVLGVFTILYSVPVILGVVHQFGAVVLFVLSLLSLFLYRSYNVFMGNDN